MVAGGFSKNVKVVRIEHERGQILEYFNVSLKAIRKHTKEHRTNLYLLLEVFYTGRSQITAVLDSIKVKLN